jgi:hypothetical protein
MGSLIVARLTFLIPPVVRFVHLKLLEVKRMATPAVDKFIQIATSSVIAADRLYTTVHALDEKGNVWEYKPDDRLCGRRSSPHQVAGQRALIEPWIRLLVTRAGASTGVSCIFGPSVMATAFRSCASRTILKRNTRIYFRTRASK